VTLCCVNGIVVVKLEHVLWCCIHIICRSVPCSAHRSVSAEDDFPCARPASLESLRIYTVYYRCLKLVIKLSFIRGRC